MSRPCVSPMSATSRPISKGPQPRGVMKQAHDDMQSGQQDTDCRNRVAEVLPDTPKTPRNFKRSR